MSAVSYVKQIYSKQGGSGCVRNFRTAKLCETFRTACVDTEEVELASTDDLFLTCFPNTLNQTVLMPKAGM